MPSETIGFTLAPPLNTTENFNLKINLPDSAQPKHPNLKKRGAIFVFLTMANKHHNRKEFLERRKVLRKKLTPAEAFLWKHLKAKQLEGRKFHKQHSIDWYIVDFYCPAEKLIIELDGQVHINATAQAYDKKRTEHIENLGFNVIRFENKMVFENLPSVLKEIKDNFISSSL